MHGKTSLVHHDGTGVFAGLPTPFEATRYHSLIVERASVPAELTITAWTDDGVVMGLRHRTLAVEGVQFHPESILTASGRDLLRNFLAAADGGAPPPDGYLPQPMGNRTVSYRAQTLDTPNPVARYAHRQRYKASFERVTSAVPHGGTVLDYGCGQGDFLNTLADLRPDLSLYGYDPESDHTPSATRRSTTWRPCRPARSTWCAASRRSSTSTTRRSPASSPSPGACSSTGAR